MFQLIFFECKKIYKSLFFWIMLLLLVLFIVTYYVFVYMNTIRPEQLIVEEKEKISQLEQAVEQDNGLSGETSKNNPSKKVLQRSKKTVQSLELKNWNGLLDVEIEMLEINNKQGMPYKYMGPSQWMSLFTEISYLEKYKLMRDRDVTPVLPIHFLTQRTVYDVSYQSPQIEEAIVHMSNKYSSSGLNFLNRLFYISSGVLGVGFFIFLFGDMFTKEGLGRHGPIHFLKTQPVHHNKILASKLIVALASSAGVLLGVIVISLLLGTVFDQFGHYNYPILIYGEEYTFSFMSLSTVLIKSTILFLMILFFCYVLLMMYSILTERVAWAVGLTLATIFIGTELSGQWVTSGFAKYNPFQYFSVMDVVTQEKAAVLQNFNFTFTSGLIALTSASTVTLLVAYAIIHLQNKNGSLQVSH